MPLSPETKIDLINTDTRYYSTLNQTPLPEDDRVISHLGWDYNEYLKLKSDPHIYSRLQKRILSVLGREVLLDREQAEKSGKTKTAINRGEKVATAILNKLHYETICSQFMMDGKLIGFACQQVDYEEVDGLILPTFTYVPPYRIIFAAPVLDDRTIPTATGEALDPHTEIAMVRGYELRLLTKEHPITGVRVPKERIVCYVFGGHTPWGLGLGYQIYGWWLVKNEARNAWLLLSDRLGSPPVMGTHNPEADLENPVSKQALRQWKTFLQSISPNGWVDMPEGFKAELLENVSSLSPDAQQALIHQANQEMSEAILGDVTFAEKDTGSYAANESQVEDMAANLTDGDCNVLDEQLQEFWGHLLELNGADRDSIVVRRKTIADRRKEESEKRQQDDDESQAKQMKLMADAGFTPTPEYVQSVFNGNWTFHGIPQLISGFPQQPYPDAPAIVPADFAESVKVGDRVAWHHATGTAQGKVKSIHKQPGTVKVNGVNVAHNGTIADPTYVITHDGGGEVAMPSSAVAPAGAMDMAEPVEVEGEVLADADWEALSQISASDWVKAVGAIVSQEASNGKPQPVDQGL